MNVSLHPLARPAHAVVAKAVCDTLTLGNADGLFGLTLILRARLTREERKHLAWATLMACDDDEAQGVAESVLGADEGAGWPLPPFEGVLEEAAFWSDLASRRELQIYAITCLARLSPDDRAAVLTVVQRRAA